MTKKWQKYIDKNPLKKEILKIIKDIAKDNLASYKIKKLKGYEDYYRIRKGKIRVVFRKAFDGNEIVAVDTRWNIYKDL